MDNLVSHNLHILGWFFRQYPLETGKQSHWTSFLERALRPNMGHKNIVHPDSVHSPHIDVHLTVCKHSANWLYANHSNYDIDYRAITRVHSYSRQYISCNKIPTGRLDRCSHWDLIHLLFGTQHRMI